VSTLVSRNLKYDMVALIMRSAEVSVYREFRVRHSTLCWYIWFQSQLRHFHKFDKFRTFVAICKDNSAINFISSKRKRVMLRHSLYSISLLHLRDMIICLCNMQPNLYTQLGALLFSEEF
jgi:hypothetical protein